MHVDLNARITIDASESHAVYSALMGPTERGSTGGAEAQPPPGRRLITRQVFGASNPCERIGPHFGVSRSGAAKCLAAPRAMTTSSIAKWCIDQIADPTAETAASQSHNRPSESDLRAPLDIANKRLTRVATEFALSQHSICRILLYNSYNAYAPWVGDPFFHQEADAIGEIGLHFSPPLPKARGEKALASAEPR
jgi:hypothetical protein